MRQPPDRVLPPMFTMRQIRGPDNASSAYRHRSLRRLGLAFDMTPPSSSVKSTNLAKRAKATSPYGEGRLGRDSDAIVGGRYGVPEGGCRLKTPTLKFHFLSTY